MNEHKMLADVTSRGIYINDSFVWLRSLVTRLALMAKDRERERARKRIFIRMGNKKMSFVCELRRSLISLSLCVSLFILNEALPITMLNICVCACKGSKIMRETSVIN